MNGFDFPSISPIIFSIGGFSLRWYSMAYLVGIVCAWILAKITIKKFALPINKQQLEDAVFFATLGIILGGRLGYVLFYGEDYFLHNPLQILAIWHGGMSFHGGAVGAVLGLWYTARSRKINFWLLTDLAALFAPIGLFLGRIANFINDELWGRVTTMPWAVRFPNGGYLPRHPSQLYEAVAEGLFIFVVLNLLWQNEKYREKRGCISLVFVLMYAFFRFFIEYFRQPDEQLGFLWLGLTMGQILSIPIFALGIYLFCRLYFNPSK